MKWDQGLGAIGMVAFAVALTAVVAIWGPIAVSKDAVELKDWLSLAGGLLAALLTIGASLFVVRPQIQAQRDATLLNVTSREEDRLETELAAIQAFSELYDATIGEGDRYLGLQKVDRYNVDLYDAGIVSSQSATHGALRGKADRVPPQMLNSLAFRYAGLAQSVFELEKLERALSMIEITGRDDDANLHFDIDHWRDQVVFWQGEIDQAMEAYHARAATITRTLLPACRRRIERGLRLLQD